jgi:hypothetical protein
MLRFGLVRWAVECSRRVSRNVSVRPNPVHFATEILGTSIADGQAVAFDGAGVQGRSAQQVPGACGSKRTEWNKHFAPFARRGREDRPVRDPSGARGHELNRVAFAIAAHPQADAFEVAEVAGCRVRTDACETTVVLESDAAREFQRAVADREATARDASHDGIVAHEPVGAGGVELEDAGGVRGGQQANQQHDQGSFHGSRVRDLWPRDCVRLC